MRNGDRPQLTDKQLTEMREVMDRDLTKSGLGVELLASIYNFGTREVIGCTDNINLAPLPDEPDPGEMRRMTIVAKTGDIPLVDPEIERQIVINGATNGVVVPADQ